MIPVPSPLAISPRAGLRLAARLWSTPAPRGIVVIAHGHGEHGGCYAEFARAVGSTLPVDVLAFDFRGHGLSTGRRGVIGRYDDLLDDLEAWIGWAGRERRGLPVVVLGHSNGGLAAIRLVETRRPLVAALILSNPSLRLIAEAPPWKRLAGQVLLRVAPWVTLQTGIDYDQLTQAPDEIALLDADPLRHHRISPPTYFGMLRHGPLAIAEAGRIAAPTCLVLGEADPITAPAAGREFFSRLGATDKTLLSYPNLRHEPLHELERARVVDAIIAWLAARLDSPVEPPPGLD